MTNGDHIQASATTRLVIAENGVPNGAKAAPVKGRTIALTMPNVGS